MRTSQRDPDLRIAVSEAVPCLDTCVETGACPVAWIVSRCDLFPVTGSTIINGTFDRFLDMGKPVVFYGTTISGLREIVGLNRFCPQAASRLKTIADKDLIDKAGWAC